MNTLELKQGIIEIVDLYYDDKEQLNNALNETNVAPDSQAMRQRAAELIQPAFDKENAIQILNACL